MIGMQNEYLVHCRRQNRVNLIIFCRYGKAHMQEILCIIQVIAWVIKGLAK